MIRDGKYFTDEELETFIVWVLKQYEDCLKIYDDCDWEDISTVDALLMQDCLFALVVVFMAGVRKQVYTEWTTKSFIIEQNRLGAKPGTEKRVVPLINSNSRPIPNILLPMILFHLQLVRLALLQDENSNIIAFWINKFGNPAAPKKICERFTKLVKKFNNDLHVTTHTFRSVSISKVIAILMFHLLTD